MPERINGGQALVVAGAIALIASLSLDWFQPGISAWTVFEIVDLLLAALAVTALAIAIGGAINPEGSLAALAPRWLPAVGIAALVIVIAALINHPPAAIGRSVETGAWVALSAAAALTVGGILSAARVSLVITLRPRERETEWSDAAPAAGNPGESDPYVEPADEEYADEYAETEYVDADEPDSDYEEPEPTAEVSMPEEEPADDERPGRPAEDDRA
jgi:hypothetical protein